MNIIIIYTKKKEWQWFHDGQMAAKGKFIYYTQNNLRFIIASEFREMDFPFNQVIIDYRKE